MTKEFIPPAGAAKVLGAVAACLRARPDQFFSININVGEITALKGRSGPLDINTTAVGNIGSVTGAHFEASTGDLNIEAARIEDELRQRYLVAADLIDDIAKEMRQARPSSKTLRAKIAKLTELALPPLVVEIARQLVRAAGFPTS